MTDPCTSFRVTVLDTLGAAPEVIEPGRIHRFSTSSRASDKAGWCQLFDDGRAGVFGDFRTGVSSVWMAQRSGSMMPIEHARIARQLAEVKAQRDRQRRIEQAVNAQRNAALWAHSRPVQPGDPASQYLLRRGLTGPVPHQLRLHPHLLYWNGGEQRYFPAMVAPLFHPDGRLLAIHRTYLTADGHKAPVPTVRKLTRTAGSLAGSCIPLHAPQHGVIGIAEGIETAQAAHLASGLPTVAAYSASNLAAYIWPAAMQRLVVFADADPAGAAAAQRLKTRALDAGLRVTVLTPSTPGADWCDVWARRTASSILSGVTA